MLPRVEGALLSYFLSSSLLPPRSHSHGLLSSTGAGGRSTRNSGWSRPQNPRLEQVAVGAHLIPPPLWTFAETEAFRAGTD